MKKDIASPVMERFRALPDFPAFEAFARALWNGQSAAMVGAGFSRTCRREKNSPIPPLWNDFKGHMATALGYAQMDGLDALRLAQEYKTLHGDSGLDQLIHRMVADTQWEPGSLHQRFLELPWRDILTTNWDTLLERTKPKTPDRIYSCVRTIQDIPHCAHPRIVKLHGSLPSHKPFIFTEDDYRTYPVRFAPFVNLAQQVMLEHELCLIGFSGIDPNFLAWSGWVRDTLSISARRIRLIGVLNLSPVSRALLEERNVTPIDLAPLVSGVHQDERDTRALELFFSALLAAKPRSPFNWDICPETQLGCTRAAESRVEVARLWMKDRKNYPGWVVCPAEERKRLATWCPQEKPADKSAEARIRFAQERIWRHRTEGIWLHAEDMKNADTHFDSAVNILPDSELTELCAELASECRRFQKWDDWERWMARLEVIGGSEAELYHAYESAQRALTCWNDEGALKATNKLSSNEPVWMMRRAGLLALLFQYREAAELYQSSLLLIRQKLLSAPKSAWLISLEAWASLFHRISHHALRDDFVPSPLDESDETRMRYVAAKADPFDTIRNLEKLVLNRISRNEQDEQQWKLSFSSGRYTPVGTIRFGGDNQCPFYYLLELMERTGAPERISNFSLLSANMEDAFRAITNRKDNDLLTFFAVYRGGDTKVLERILPRMGVASVSDTTINFFIRVIPRRIDRLLRSENSLAAERYLKFLLEAAARIVVRTPSKQALDIFEWAIESLEAPTLGPTCYSSIDRILKGALESMVSDERQKAMYLALHLKTSSDLPSGMGSDWPEVFEKFSEEDAKNFVVCLRSCARIDALIELVKGGSNQDQARALMRLRILYKAGKLTSVQSDALEAVVWEHCGESGWPFDKQVHPWVFLELPGKGRAEKMFQENIVARVANGEIDHSMLMSLRKYLENAEIVLPKEIVVRCIKRCLEWAPSPETDDVARALSGRESLDRATAREIGEILAQGLLPRVNVEDLPNEVGDMLNPSRNFPRIPSLAATAYHSARLWPDLLPKAIAQIRSAIASRDPDRVYPAFRAVKQFIENAPTPSDVPTQIKELLLHACEQRTQPGLGSTLELLAEMVEKDQLSSDDADRLSSALPVVLEEYYYGQKNLEVISMAELPGVRRGVYRIVKLLVSRRADLQVLKTELENDALPEVRHG